ncbi:MAG TPA: hypothetical protein VFU30_04010 [Gaiellaceae bacterium]|nr:hypothetical protein [Gaiellaceae bacterium]
MSSEPDDRHGIIFIAPHPHQDHRGDFTAYWDNEEPDKGEPPRMIEESPVFADVEEAVSWGRARARRVVVRLGDDDTTMYSAGSERLPWTYSSPGDLMPEWPR